MLGLLLFYLEVQENVHTAKKKKERKKSTETHIQKNIKGLLDFMTGKCNFYLLIHKL